MAHAAGDAHEYPVYGYHFRVTFPALDADGDLVTAAATPDSEVSKDAGTFVDCTNEATELATASGMYYLDLTGAEMTAKQLAVIVKSADIKTTPIVLYPRRLPTLETGTAQAGAASTITLAAAASDIDGFYNGLFVGITNDSPAGADNQLRRIVSYVGSTKVATVESPWGTNPSVASTYEILIPEGYSLAAVGGKSVGVVDAATMRLKQLEIENSGGSALVATATGGNGDGIAAFGNGSGAGLAVTAGATGHGILGTGGATSGHGMRVLAPTIGDGLRAEGATADSGSDGLVAVGRNAGASFFGLTNGIGLSCAGSGTGEGIRASGGSTAAGARLSSGLSGPAGVEMVGSGAGPGLLATGGATGHGIAGVGGGTSGDGMNLSATSGAGLSATGGTGGHGAELIGATTGAGLSATGGATGAGAIASAGSGDDWQGTGLGGGTPPTAAAIADAVWDEAIAGHVAVGSFGEEVQLHALSSEITALNDPTAAAIADAVWDEAIADHVAVGSFGEEVQAHALSSEISALNDPTVAAIADAVWDEAIAGHLGVGSTGEALNGASAPTAAAVADAVWDEAIADHTGVGSFGEEVQLHALSSEITALNDLSAAQVNAEVDTALSDYGALKPTVAGRTLDVTVGGTAGIDWANVEAPTTAVVLSGTTIGVTTANTDMRGTDNAALASVATETRLAELDAANLPADIDTIVAFGAPPTAAAIADQVWDELIAGHAIVGSTGEALAGASAPTAAAVADAVWDEAIAGHVAVGSFGEEVQAHALSSEITALNDPTAAAIADAVWDEALAGHLGVGSTGEALDASGGGVTAAAIADAVWEELIADHSGTGGSTAEALANASAPTAAAVADAVWDEARAGHVAVGSFGEGVASVQGDVTGNVDGTVAVCTTNTDMRGTDNAALASVATEARLAELDAANLPADIDAILADTSVLGSRVTLTGTANAGDTTTQITLTGGVATDNYYNGQLVVITGGTGVGQSRQILTYIGATAVATPTRDWLVAPDGTSTFVVIAADVAGLLEAGIAQAGGANTITLDTTASAVTGTYRSAFVMITGGTGSGQTRLIDNYIGATKVATVTPPWTTAPDATSIYQIVPSGRANVGQWLGGTVTGDGDWALLQSDVTAILADTADMQPKLGTPAADISADIAAVLAAIVALNDPTANAIADALLDRANGIETGWTLRQTLRIVLSALGAKSSGHSGGAPVYRDVNDTKDRITAVATADGRASVTLDAT